MKLWVTKYALTDGITENQTDGEVSEHGYMSVKGMWSSLKLGKDAHESREAAIDRARTMQANKIASLRKQITKLEKMEFK